MNKDFFWVITLLVVLVILNLSVIIHLIQQQHSCVDINIEKGFTFPEIKQSWKS